MTMGRHPHHEGEIHWIQTGPRSVGDWVSDEEIEAASEYLDKLVKERKQHDKKSE